VVLPGLHRLRALDAGLDLGVFHRKAHVVSLREATIWTVVWIALALVFNFLLYRYALWKFPQDPALRPQRDSVRNQRRSKWDSSF